MKKGESVMLFLVTQQLFTEPVQSDWAQVRLQVSSKPGRENVNYRASPSRTVTLSVSHCSLSSSPSSLFHLCLLTNKTESRQTSNPQIQTLTSDQNPVRPLLTSLTNNTHLLLIFTHRNAEEKEEQEYLEERRRQEDDDKASGDKNGGQTMKR